MKYRRYLGKVDFYGNGRKDHKAYIDVSLVDGRFSATAEVWNRAETDILMGGQCVDAVAHMVPRDKRASRIAAIWKRWHLNDMRAGSPAQEAYLNAHNSEFPGYPTSYYEWACDLLNKAGLHPDPETGYRYGSAWLKEEIPADVIAEVMSWAEPAADK